MSFYMLMLDSSDQSIEICNTIIFSFSFMLQKLFALVDQTATPDNVDALQNMEVLLIGHLITVYLKITHGDAKAQEESQSWRGRVSRNENTKKHLKNVKSPYPFLLPIPPPIPALISRSASHGEAGTGNIVQANFRAPFVRGCRVLGEALHLIREGSAMIRTKGEAGTNNIIEVVRHVRSLVVERGLFIACIPHSSQPEPATKTTESDEEEGFFVALPFLSRNTAKQLLRQFYAIL
ncbi:Pyridoxal biosynthesis protein PDX1 [Platanthera guangdongensis]|uniref:Pyridoxal biosynthesis protein PDX1 n=1 Tax=Platanthera guangdongensis TaxID=2320717 RepID=A0ABR2MLS5_9ASPA